MEAGGRARVRKKKKKKCRDIYFAFIVSNFRFLFFLPLVSLFHPFLAELCRLVPYYLRKAREKLKITPSVLRLEWEFCVFTVPFQVQFVVFFFEKKKKKKDPGTIFGSSRRLRCAIWVKCRKATRNWPSHRLASLGHLVGLLVKHIEWSHFLSLSLVWGCWFDYPLGM